VNSVAVSVDVKKSNFTPNSCQAESAPATFKAWC